MNVPATFPVSEKNALLFSLSDVGASDVDSSESDEVADAVDEIIGSVGDDDAAAPAPPTKSDDDEESPDVEVNSLLLLSVDDDWIDVEFADWVMYNVLTCCWLWVPLTVTTENTVDASTWVDISTTVDDTTLGDDDFDEVLELSVIDGDGVTV